MLCAVALSSSGTGLSLETALPVVIKTSPAAGATDVDPNLTEVRVTFSKPMLDGSWSWSSWGEGNYPETTGEPRYLDDGRTCVLPVKLEPDKFYATWLNSQKHRNFKDREGRPAAPYLLTFTTAGKSSDGSAVDSTEQQYTVLAGDTLSKIAKIHSDNGSKVSVGDILNANPGLNPARLRVGQKILMPAGTASAELRMPELHPLTSAEDLPGKLTFRGRYQHRSRGRDIETPSQIWLKETKDGGLNVLTHLPWMGTRELASGDPGNRLASYRIERGASGSRSGYHMDLELSEGMALLTRRGVRQDCDDRELKVPVGAQFDPNTRPDPYCAANILLRAFDVGEGEAKEFHVYDWDNSGEALVDYTIHVSHAGRERVEVPAGVFQANHLILKQLTSADTWFKKRVGHVTDFWVLDNNVIVRVLRHREPYEMVLLDYNFPEKLEGAIGARKYVRVVLDGDRMTFEGQDASWGTLDGMLDSVPEPAQTVLEWAVPSTQITLQQQNDWTSRFLKLAKEHGFEHSSYVGVHPFGSTGVETPVRAVAGQFATAIQERDNDLLQALSTDAVVEGWIAAVVHFGDELRVALNGFGAGFEPLGQIDEVLVEGDLAAVKVAQLTEPPAYLALFFCRTPEGWRNCCLQNSPSSKSLKQNLEEFKNQEGAVEKLRAAVRK